MFPSLCPSLACKKNRGTTRGRDMPLLFSGKHFILMLPLTLLLGLPLPAISHPSLGPCHPTAQHSLSSIMPTEKRFVVQMAVVSEFVIVSCLSTRLVKKMRMYMYTSQHSPGKFSYWITRSPRARTSFLLARKPWKTGIVDDLSRRYC